jgi:hypothetical protein
VFSGFVSMLSASISIPQGAGIDAARLYITLAFGLLILNCLRGGIGGVIFACLFVGSTIF